MPFPVAIDKFEGPLDLLLQLVETQELEITEISLLQVVEPFIQHVEQHRGSIATEELADFLLIAAKLVYLKSRALMPSFSDEELDEGPDLATQLRMYKAFAGLAKKIQLRVIEHRRSFGKQKSGVITPPRLYQGEGAGGEVARRVDVPGLTANQMHDIFDRVLRRLQPLIQLPQAAIDRVVTIEEKMSQLQQRIKTALKVSFRSILKEAKDKKEMIVSFLALLELVKQRVIQVRQGSLFEEIELSAHESTL